MPNKFQNVSAAIEEATSQQISVFAIPAPKEGSIRGINVRQSSGTAEGFYIDIFNKDVTDIANVHERNKYRVVYRISVDSPNLSGSLLGQDFPYVLETPNSDVGALGTNLYALIYPSGTGDKNFGVNAIVEVPI